MTEHSLSIMENDAFTQELLTGHYSLSLETQLGQYAPSVQNPNQHWLAMAIKTEKRPAPLLFGQLPQPTFMHYFAAEGPLIGCVVPTPQLEQKQTAQHCMEAFGGFDKTAQMGVGNMISGLRRTQESWYQALIALGLAPEFGNLNISYYETSGAYTLLASLGFKQLKEYRDKYLAKLLNDRLNSDLPSISEGDGYNLFETLKNFLLDRNILQTAERLGYHRNAIIYRAKIISQLTEIQLKGPDNRLFDLETAVRAHILLPVMESALRLSGL